MNVARSYIASMRATGLRDATAALYDRCYERFCEHRLGIATAEWHEQYDPDRPHFRGYAPTTYGDWRMIRQGLAVDQNSTFVDYGSGLGRTAILAAQLKFKRVIGIEFDPDLVARARNNLRKSERYLVAPIEIICADATAFDVPLDASVFFFCNPFTGSILAGVLAKIHASIKARPRPLQIICNLPHQSAFEAEIMQVDWIALERRISNRGRLILFFSRRERLRRI